MFEKYLICTPGFKNVTKNGQATGFQLNVRISYYRGIFLSEVERFEVEVDGEKFGPDKITASIGKESFPLTQLAKATYVRWHFGDPLTLTISKPGGLAPGLHVVKLTESLRISYGAREEVGPVRVSTAIATKKITMVV